MKRKIAIAAVAILTLSLACTYPLWATMVFAGTPPTDDSGIMTVFYKIADEHYLFWCDLTAKIIDNGDGTWNVYSPQVTATGVNQAHVTYNYYKYKPIPVGYNGTITDLGLLPPSAEDLPRSQHIGKLVEVNPSAKRPAVVTRYWRGLSFNVSCFVEQDIVDMWIADTLNIGDWVTISFIEEIPYEQEYNLAVVTGKVYKSW